MGTLYTIDDEAAIGALALADTFPVHDASLARTKKATVEQMAEAVNGPGVSVQLFDDFLGDVIEDGWSAAKGSDGQGIVATVVSGAAGGAVRLTSGDTTTVAESLSSLTHGLNWKANQGGLVFEAKVTPAPSGTVADAAYFIGLTDALATGTLEEPATLSGTTITYVADDAVGFLYDTGATTDVFKGVSVKATTGVAFASALTGPAPVATTAITFRIELTAAGVAELFVNGASIGTLTGVTATVALTPIVCVMARTTTVKTIDVDYIYMRANRP
jgi:hypothetical protein